MRLTAKIKTDVLVMGAGLAGVSAAIAAAEQGARVCLCSSSVIFSGSSFYPGTWGLGLIAPEDEGDIRNLSQTIRDVGGGVVVPQLVDTLTQNIQRYIDKLEAMGCQLKRPVDGGQREYIPCFDYKNRNWYGILQQPARAALARRLQELEVVLLPDTEVFDLVMERGRIQGAVTLSQGRLEFLSCGALVLAGGGMGGIFQYRLNTSDVTGVGQYLALRAGASLINTEFMQMFLGYINPAPKTIYNEKMFRYTNFCAPGTDRSIFEGVPPERLDALLEQRSGHGPFTARLEDREIDRRIGEYRKQNGTGVEISYKNWMKKRDQQPEFIATYFDWLQESKHLTMEDRVELGIFAHASNGGILIDPQGSTGVPGLFACGEATGGMHGADRIGGLSTANGLVFGNLAGAAAAQAGRDQERSDFWEQPPPTVTPEAGKLLEELQARNSDTLMVARDGPSLEAAAGKRWELEAVVRETSCVYRTGFHDSGLLRDTLHLRAALLLTDCVQQAALLRRESRGSHDRLDCPLPDAAMERCILCTGPGPLAVRFQE